MNDIIGKVKILLNKKQKLKLIIIFVLMLIGAILETLGVSLIYSLISVVADPNILENNKLVKWICEVLEIHSINIFVIFLLGFLIFIFIFKNLFIYFEYYVQYRFVYNNRFIIQKQLISTYLNRSYEYFLHSNSGEIIRVVSNDSKTAFALLTSLLNLFTEAIISLMLVVLLLSMDFFMTILIAIILGLSFWVISKVIKPILRNAGLSLQKNTALANKWLLQSISGVKEIKVAQKERFFLNQYAKYGVKEITAERKYSVLSNIPRLLIESVCMSTMLTVIAILVYMGRDLSSMIPQLGAFAAATVRLLPSANRLSASYNALSYQEPALDKLLENLQLNSKGSNEFGTDLKKGNSDYTLDSIKKISIKDVIELKNITYRYPDTEKNIFENAFMKIPVGKAVGIIGTSGSGKTTAVDILLGLLEPLNGDVLVDKENIRDNYSEWLAHIGYIPQMIFMLDDSIRSNVAFGFSEKEISDAQVWKALKESELESFVKGLPNGINTEIGERGVRLSGGQRQRIGIARALYTDPELLIFDEATSALDNDTESAIMESINSLHGKKTMIIIAHRLGTIDNCDIVYRVENGRIIKER